MTQGPGGSSRKREWLRASFAHAKTYGRRVLRRPPEGDLLDEYVAVYGRELIRFCDALAGIAGQSLAAQGLAATDERSVRRGAQSAHRAVLRRVVQQFIRGRYAAPQDVEPRAWAAAVLVALEDVPTAELRWFVGRGVRPADVDVPIPRPAAVPDDLVRRARAAVRVQRGARRSSRAMVVGVVLLVLVAGVGVYKVVTHVSRPGVAEGTGFIKWQPRGDLLLDEDLRPKAEAVWRDSMSTHLEDVQTLWAGHVGDGKLVVLQAYDEDKVPQVAAIGEERSGLAVLRSDEMEIAPDLLVIPYSGLPELSLTNFSDGARVVRVLVDPGAQMERRALPIKSFADVDKLGPWVTLRVRDGLSDPWVDLSANFAVTALRDRGTTYLLSDGGTLLPDKPVLGAGPPKLRADSEPPPTDEQVADDVLAIEQYAYVPETDVSLIWVGFSDSDAASTRLYNLVPRPGCPDDCDRGIWAVDGTDGIANPMDASIIDGSVVIHYDDGIELIGAPGSVVCTLSGGDVDYVARAHLEAPEGLQRRFECRGARGQVVSKGTILKP
jgi:hypothetical protein